MCIYGVTRQALEHEAGWTRSMFSDTDMNPARLALRGNEAQSILVLEHIDRSSFPSS